MTKVVAANPCELCDLRFHDGKECAGYKDLQTTLYGTTAFRAPTTPTSYEKMIYDLISTWVSGIIKSIDHKNISEADFPRSFSALYDVCASAIYGKALIDNNGRTKKKALACGSHGVFPYTWMCPICISEGSEKFNAYLPGYKVKVGDKNDKDKIKFEINPEMLAKPEGSEIGFVGGIIMKSILRYIGSNSSKPFIVRTGGGRRGEFDFTLTNGESLTFVELKASPLIAFPIVYSRAESSKHEWLDKESLTSANVFMFVAAASEYIPLSNNFNDMWPIPDLIKYFSDSDNVLKIFKGWIRHHDVYKLWKNEPDDLRWHRFGCGNFGATVPSPITEDSMLTKVEMRVGNTKELPGLDRTDDIKKGTTQLILFSRLKFKCSKNALKTMLLGNLYAETHHDDYFDPIYSLMILDNREKSDDLSEIGSKSRWIFDAIIGFSDERINDTELASAFDYKNLMANIRINIENLW